MAFRVRWRELDVTAADALRLLINEKLEAVCRRTSHIDSLQLTALDFGPTVPMIELVGIGSSDLAIQQDFEAPDLDDVDATGTAVLGGLRYDGFVHDDSEEEGDYIGQYLGSDGLSLSFRLKHGGGITFAGSVRLTQAVDLSPTCGIKAAMPIYFDVQDINLDALLVIDVYRSTCRIWLEPGHGPKTPPISRMDVSVTFGTSGNTVVSPVVGQLIVAEIQELLISTVCSPQCVEIHLGPSGDTGDIDAEQCDAPELQQQGRQGSAAYGA
jgi:hypothetical protein